MKKEITKEMKNALLKSIEDEEDKCQKRINYPIQDWIKDSVSHMEYRKKRNNIDENRIKLMARCRDYILNL